MIAASYPQMIPESYPGRLTQRPIPWITGVRPRPWIRQAPLGTWEFPLLPILEPLRGCAVFPCVPGGKVPATSDGWKDATSDAAKIAAWREANPNWNWAVACGPSGFFVVDVDMGGLAWWEKLLADNADLAAAVAGTFQVRTPSGGLHIYFRGYGPTTASRIAPGIDTRGGIPQDGKIVSGGYVVLPGSRTAKGYYEALNNNPIASLPESIKLLIPDRKKATSHGLEKIEKRDLPRNVQTAVDLLTRYVTDGNVSIEGQGGNNRAFQVAASVLDKGISPHTCYELLQQHWNPHCQPPWEDHELEIIINNAWNHGDDTKAGNKGIQANVDAFAHLVGLDVAEAPARADRDKLKWLHDYADNVQDPTWLIPAVLPAHGVGMLYGPSGSYKSFIALDMSLCLAYGHAGQWGAPPVKNDVLFLAGEGPVATGKKRWPAWLAWQKISDRTGHRFIFKDRVPAFSDTQGWENIKLDLAEMGAKPALIVIDTLTRLLVGLDENQAKDVAMVTSFLEALARYYECFILVLHHTGKDEKKGARGSSALIANFDVAISTSKRPGGVEMNVVKQKDADVSELGRLFAVTSQVDSIVLAETEALAEAPKPAEKAVVEWSSPAEIIATLNANGGRMNTNMLTQDIAKKHNLDVAMVRRHFAGRKDLDNFKDGDVWTAPVEKQEFDL